MVKSYFLTIWCLYLYELPFEIRGSSSPAPAGGQSTDFQQDSPLALEINVYFFHKF